MDLIVLKDKMYEKYDFIFSKEEYDEISLKLIDKIKEETIENLDLIFLENLDLYVNTYLSKLYNNKKYIYHFKFVKLFTDCVMVVETPPINSRTKAFALIKPYIPPT